MRFNERFRLAFCAILISVMIVFSFACGGESGSGGNGGNGGEPTTYSISGQIATNGTGLSGVTMGLSGTSTGTTTTDSNGNYSLTNLSNGSYTVMPSLFGCLFDPSYRDVTISGASEIAVDFVAEPGASKVIGLAGGTVEVTNPLSPLYGIKVEVPPEALDTDSTISIETTTVSPSYNTDSRASSPIFELESPDASYFNIPVTVTVPYDESLVDDESYIGLFIYNPSTDSWQSTTTYEIDTSNNTISVATMHFSIFQVVSLLLDAIGVDVDTGFSPYLNGFDITNTGGWCFGMSAYSKWFFDNKKPNKLFGFYEYSVARLVAEEAHLEITDFGGTILGFAFDLDKVLYSLPYRNLYTALVFTGKPQVLGMVDFFPLGGHAVVAYKIQDGEVYIYDNRYPGIAPILTPDYFGSFLDYENFTSFILLDYSVAFTDFEDIYDEHLPDIPPLLGTEWITISAGPFTSGEYDVIESIDYDYKIMKYEVTNEEYAQFLREALAQGLITVDASKVSGFYEDDIFVAGTYEFLPLRRFRSYEYPFWYYHHIRWDGTDFYVVSGKENHPVTEVLWAGANAFAKHYGLLIPTREEWEKAARGTSGYEYSYGEDLDPQRANYNGSGDPFEPSYLDFPRTTPVGFYNGQIFSGFQTVDSPSPYGLYDMTGNVTEIVYWVWTTVDEVLTIGGSWVDSFPLFLSAYHVHSWEGDYFGAVGFRCVLR